MCAISFVPQGAVAVLEDEEARSETQYTSRNLRQLPAVRSPGISIGKRVAQQEHAPQNVFVQTLHAQM